MRHGFALLWRVVLAVLAAIIGLVLAPSAVAGGEQQVPVVATYAYDAHCPFDAPGDTTTERGPPATDDVHTACDTVDRRSHGASAYADGPTTRPGTTYAHTSAAVPVALATTTTSGDGEVADGDLSMLSGARSAAKGLANEVPAYAGGKTAGTLVGPGGAENALISGWHPPAALMPKGTPGMNIVTKSHVEAHAAAIMRNEGLANATLWINRAPCGGATGCRNLLPRMVPSGSTLTINVVPNGSARSIVETLIIRGVG